jgi:hypothetical protein
MVAPVPAQITKPRFPLHAAARRRPLLTTHHSLPTLFSLPSSAPRGVNISPVLSRFRILPVVTGVCHSSFPTSDFQTSRHAKSFVCIGSLPLYRLFALFSAFASFVFNRLEPLFTKHPGWGGTPTRPHAIAHTSRRHGGVPSATSVFRTPCPLCCAFSLLLQQTTGKIIAMGCLR